MSKQPSNGGANQPEFPTIDALLAQYAKNLQPGQSISIPLYKGKQTMTTIDPIQASQAKKAAAAIGAKEPAKSVIKRHEVSFPRLFKFIETVEKPNFQKAGEFQDGRLYMEDIPKAKVSAIEFNANTVYMGCNFLCLSLLQNVLTAKIHHVLPFHYMHTVLLDIMSISTGRQ